MAFNHRPLSIFRAALLFFAAAALAADETNNTRNEERVGWQEGPNTRGTLNLVWSCSITIFACTWTVTHLNLPSPYDTALQRVLRRVKWMAINIIFPEFILSKAICDLRQALDELRQFGQKLPTIRREITIRFTSPYGDGIDVERSWEVEYPPYYNILYRCLWLDPPLSEVTTPLDVETGDLSSSHRLQQTQPQGHQQHSLDQNISLASLERPNEVISTTSAPHKAAPCHGQAGSLSEENSTPESRQDRDGSLLISEREDEDVRAINVHNAKPQIWTIFHSYYAQMGGIRLRVYPDNYGELVTATMLTSQYVWNKMNHPLKHLELSRQDIEDKSKADWLLKVLAMLQILWLVLSVAIRGITGLHITQLEIATVAFAVMAVLTYVASWWKPKDISQATFIPLLCHGAWEHTPRLLQLSSWLYSPERAADAERRQRLHIGFRVPNDVTWMKTGTPSMPAFLAVTSLLFGGIHCVAWNFEFPSRAELIAWRVACVVTAVLPGVTLTVSILLSHLSTERFDIQRQKVLMEEFNKLPPLSSDWQELILNRELWLNTRESWESFIDSIPGGSSIWSHEVLETLEKTDSFPWDFAHFHENYSTSRYMHDKALKGQIQSYDLNYWRHICLSLPIFWEKINPEVSEAWKQLEMHAGRLFNNGDHRILNSSYVEPVLQACNTVNDRFKTEIMPVQYGVCTASRIISILSCIVYLVARLLTIALFLASLRSVSADVYQVTSWVNLLPKIS